jgi:hypothetical protein
VGGGALVYFGGESPPSPNPGKDADFKVNAWDHVWVYDIKGDKWYKQDTTGTAFSRSDFCASTLYDEASKSWQIWAIGGADLDSNSKVVDTVSILSIPSFQWFSAGAAIPRMSISCQRFGSQIFVMGGRTELSITGGDDYESAAFIYDTNKQASVSTFSPSSTAYEAPASVRTAISSASTPATWADPAVQALFMTSATDNPASSATGNPASGGAEPTPSSSDSRKISRGAIGGIVVGVILGIAAVVALIWFLFLRRRKVQRANMKGDDSIKQPFVDLKAELDSDGVEGMGKGLRVEMEAGHVTATPVELDNAVFVKPHRQSKPYELA